MIRKIPGFLLLICLVLVSGCRRDVPTLLVKDLSGDVQVQRGGDGVFVPLQNDDTIAAGDRIRAAYVENTYIELTDARSLLAVGPGATVLIQSLSDDPSLTRTQINLEEGSIYAAAEKPLGEGTLEILTKGGSAALQGSGMVITFDLASSSTTVNCTSGTVNASAGGQTVNLQQGESTGFVPSGVPEPPTKRGDATYNLSPLASEIFQQKYMEITLEDQSQPTKMFVATDTQQPTRTVTLTKAPTWTPYSSGPTSTAVVEGAEPTRRPTTTRVPGAEGLTPEEEINQGLYTFAISCQSWGNCVCDSALANPIQTLTVVFTNGGVLLSGGGDGESLFYPQMAPNLYMIVDSGMTADITFLMEGFEFTVIKGGKYCSVQTFTRQP